MFVRVLKVSKVWINPYDLWKYGSWDIQYALYVPRREMCNKGQGKGWGWPSYSKHLFICLCVCALTCEIWSLVVLCFNSLFGHDQQFIEFIKEYRCVWKIFISAQLYYPSTNFKGSTYHKYMYHFVKCQLLSMYKGISCHSIHGCQHGKVVPKKNAPVY